MKALTNRLLISIVFAFTAVGCTDNKAYETAYCALADISGTYAQEKDSVARIIKAGILPEMIPGDSIFLIKIDSNSYSEENLQRKLVLDYKPSETNAQKMTFATTLDEFASDPTESQNTDISGAMMLCSDYLKETKAGTQVMIIFSDMQEDLPKGVVRNFSEAEFNGIDIAAMNIIKLSADSSNPEVYRNRLKVWEANSKKAGARSWTTMMDASKIQEFIHQVKSL
jgi:hypothetical protein